MIKKYYFKEDTFNEPKQDIEVGGGNISLNGKRMDKYSNPEEYRILQAVQKDFPEKFAEVSQKTDLRNPDVTIEGDTVTIRLENGEIIAQEKIENTKFLKAELNGEAKFDFDRLEVGDVISGSVKDKNLEYQITKKDKDLITIKNLLDINDTKEATMTKDQYDKAVISKAIKKIDKKK